MSDCLDAGRENKASEFRWRSKLYHLTYAGHIDRALLFAILKRYSSCKRRVLGTSIVHEISNAEVPYDHTHFAWFWDSAPNLHGAHIFDVHDECGNAVHPHVVNKKSLRWMQGLFTRYHLGHKVDTKGKPVFVRPAGGPWQQLQAGFEWDESLVVQVSEAHDLIEGVQLAGVAVRSVHDVLLLQNAKRPRPFEHNFERSSFRVLELPEAYSSRRMGTLHIFGAINLGKTEWALAQFDNPLLVTDRDQLLDFRAGIHDGIVLDKIIPRKAFSLEECEALTDWTQPAAIRCRYKLARIPKHTPKIVVTNLEFAWPDDPFGQLVGRRVATMRIVGKTFEEKGCE